jgi:hypothetical protein
MTYSARFKIRFLLAYVATVLMGAWVVETRIGRAVEAHPEVEREVAIIGPVTVHHVAARDLRAHHRLSPRDLVAAKDLPGGLAARMEPTSTLAGLYLLAPIDSGGLVRPTDLADRPSPSVPGGQRLVSIPIDSDALRHRLEGGMHVTLRYGESANAPGLEVLAVDCRPPGTGVSPEEASDCDLLVSISDSLWDELSGRADVALSIDPALTLDSAPGAKPEEAPVSEASEEGSQ